MTFMTHVLISLGCLFRSSLTNVPNMLNIFCKNFVCFFSSIICKFLKKLQSGIYKVLIKTYICWKKKHTSNGVKNSKCQISLEKNRRAVGYVCEIFAYEE